MLLYVINQSLFECVVFHYGLCCAILCFGGIKKREKKRAMCMRARAGVGVGGGGCFHLDDSYFFLIFIHTVER